MRCLCREGPPLSQSLHRTRRHASRVDRLVRWTAETVIAERACLALAIVATLFGCFERAEPATHIVPAGFVGEVLIVFGVPDGVAPEVRDGRRIYRIPETGILRTQFAPTYGWSEPQYFWASSSDAEATPIPQGPGSTIHDTPENRAHSVPEILHYIVGTTAAPVPDSPGSFSSESPCSVKYARFFVGTRSLFLDHVPQIDVSEYLERNPVECPSAV